MANVLSTTAKVLAKNLTDFKNEMNFVATIKSYSKEFGNVVLSKKTGKTINITKPARFIPDGGVGLENATFVNQDIVEEEIALSINSYRKIGVSFETQDQVLDLTDMKDQVTDPKVIAMASYVERDHLLQINQGSQVVLAGTGGLTFADAEEALALFQEMAAPDAGRIMNAPQRLHSKMVGNVSNFFNPGPTVSMQYLKGYAGQGSGFEWMRNELIPTHRNGTANGGAFADGVTVLGAVTATVTNGVDVLAVDTITTDGTIIAGSIIEIVGTNAVHPIVRDDLGHRRQYSVLTTETSAAGAVSLTMTERFVDDSGVGTGIVDKSLQNVTTLPTTGAIVYHVGETNTLYKQGVAYVPEAFGCAFVRLTDPAAGAKSDQQNVNGMIMRALQTYDHDPDVNIYRLDSKYGSNTPRPEWVVRMWQKIA